MTASAGAWYRVGTVNVTNGQQSIVGVNTNWQNDVISIAVGDIFTLDAKTWYEVTAVNSDTSLTLDREFEGATQSAVNYAIVRNTSGTLLTRIAGQIAVQFNQKQLFLDELRTWLNSDNAVEELTDSHGVKTQLKTPAQMVRDHDEKLAELDAIHPYPWAMRKVEFEAMRAANEEKYAASGFVHKGKEYAADLGNVINQGMYVNPASAVQERAKVLHLGRNAVSQTGESKTDYPFINIAGVVTKLLGADKEYTIGAWDRDSFIVKLPPAEDGTRTYDSATGVSVTHATPALAFAAETATNKVVTDRVDMWGVEPYLRKITDNDPFVYKYGLIQSLATNINGVTTVSDNVRPITYFAWYEGDTTSRGKGVNWQTATEAQRIAIASDPENNIYFDDETGKFYQWCVRGRSFAGAGNGDWKYLDNKEDILGFSTFNRVYVKGLSNNDIPFVGSSDANHYRGYGATANDSPSLGVFTTHSQYKLSKGVNGECYFLVCDTVPRLNKGASHPLNELGTAFVRLNNGGANVWSRNDAVNLSSKADCFDPTKINQNTSNPMGDFNVEFGSLASGGSGRPDGRHYDAIYASGQGGVCRDMRYPAWGLTSEDFAEQDLKIKSGEYRGREALTTPLKKNARCAASSFAIYLDGEVGPDIYNHVVVGEKVYIRIASSEGVVFKPDAVSAGLDLGNWVEMIIIEVTGRLIASIDGVSPTLFTEGNGKDIYVDIIFPNDIAGYYPNDNALSIASEYTHTEVIGDLEEIMSCEIFKDGWVGSWNSTQVIPSVITTVELTKPAISLLGSLVTTDNATTWSSQNPTLNNATNTIQIGGGATSNENVYLVNYQTKARVTTSSTISEIHGAISDVNYLFTSMDSLDNRGRLLNYSLTGLISTHAPVATTIGLGMIRLESLPIVPSTGKLYGSNIAFGELRHSPLSLGAPSNDSPAFKAVNYKAVKNHQGFINYAYAQLTYDATAGDWGDDGKIHIADNQTTMPDENGHINLVGMAQCVEPIGWLKNDK